MIQLNKMPNAQTISLQIFKGCLPQILLGPFLNTLSNLLLGYFDYEPSENAMIEFLQNMQTKTFLYRFDSHKQTKEFPWMSHC